MPRLSQLDMFQYVAYCMSCLGRVIVVLVHALYGLSLTAVFSSNGLLAASTHAALCGMGLWSYWSCVMSDPGIVPEGWVERFDAEAAQGAGLQLQHYRFCRHCKQLKPPRAHHCRITDRCVLRMDHYCVWVVNCIGLLNHKAFILFLAYTCLASSSGCLLLFPSFLAFFRQFDIDVKARAIMLFMAFVLDAMFALSLAGFLVLHIRMMIESRTTIEYFEKEDMSPWPYDKGWFGNMKEVLGSSPRSWLFPHHSRRQWATMRNAALLADDTRELRGS